MVLVSSTIIAVSGVVTAMAQGYWMMLVFRFGLGVGLGGVVIPYDTLAEFLPNKDRSKYVHSSRLSVMKLQTHIYITFYLLKVAICCSWVTSGP